MTTADKRTSIIEFLTEPNDIIRDEQVDFIYLLLQYNINDKRELMKIVGYTEEQQGKIDTAIPIDYARKVEELLPCFNGHNHVYDYTKKSFGEMFNVIEAFGEKVISIFGRY